MIRRYCQASAAVLCLLAFAACGISPSDESTTVALSVNRPSAFADYSTVVTATATVTRNGFTTAGLPVTFALPSAVTLLSPASGLSTDGNGQATVRFKRFPMFSNSSTATVSAQHGSIQSPRRTVTFLRPAVGTNLLTVSSDATTAGKFLFQGFGLGSAGGTGVGGMDVTIRYSPPLSASQVTVVPAELFAGFLTVNTSIPGELKFVGISFDPIAEFGTFATITFPAGSGATVTGMTVNSLTDASPATTPLAARTVIVNP
jgi:hypothetical protein